MSFLSTVNSLFGIKTMIIVAQFSKLVNLDELYRKEFMAGLIKCNSYEISTEELEKSINRFSYLLLESTEYRCPQCLATCSNDSSYSRNISTSLLISLCKHFNLPFKNIKKTIVKMLVYRLYCRNCKRSYSVMFETMIPYRAFTEVEVTTVAERFHKQISAVDPDIDFDEKYYEKFINFCDNVYDYLSKHDPPNLRALLNSDHFLTTYYIYNKKSFMLGVNGNHKISIIYTHPTN